MSSNLHQASSQWATRPADQRFASVLELHEAAVRFRQRAAERLVRWDALKVEARAGSLALIGPTGAPATFTHHAFGQLSARAGAPAGYLRQLPPAMVADCLNITMPKEDRANLLLARSNGDDSVTIHALLTEKYQRIWDSEVTDRLLRLEGDGWKVPPARPAMADQPGARIATEADCLVNSRQMTGMGGLAIKPGDMIAPAGLYASDHDVFAFMVREDRPIDAGEGRALNRGFFVWNSEVGAASFGIMTFLYDAVCGNHIVWGAKDVKKVRVRHVGDARDRMGHGFRAHLIEYANAGAADDVARIKRARSYMLGDNKQDVLDAIFGKRLTGLTQSAVTKAYTLAESNEHIGEGSPRSLWGMVNGLTRVSQESGYTDDRVAIDRAAGKLMEIVF